jgi:protoheme IX farnesyltransferase
MLPEKTMITKNLRQLPVPARPIPVPSMALPGDYFALMKPRLMSLVIFTALVGMMLARQGQPVLVALCSLLAIAVGAGASGALNMVGDADLDPLMSRTRQRPIPAGRVTRDEALGFAITLATGSVMVLGLVANWLAALLLAFTILFYGVIYTLWLKRSTPQNIVIGGAAGALPPMIGQVAMTGQIDLIGISLFAIIFFWTPPHFWALALIKADDYARAGIPMMPNVAGTRSTHRQILAYTLILVGVSSSPYLLGFGGIAYLAVAGIGGTAMLLCALALRDDVEHRRADRAAGRLFAVSILYLFALFATLLVESTVAGLR